MSVSLGQDFSVSAKYSSIPDVKVIEYTISLKSSAIVDLNADGFPDMRVSWDPVRRVEVWYQGHWAEVQRSSGDGRKRLKRLLDGTPIIFNDSKGIWLADKPNDGQTH